MDRLLVACALSAVVGLVLLGTIAAVHEPAPIAIERLARYEGQRVCVDALVAHVRPTSAGAHLLMSQGDRSLAAFARFEPSTVPGDRALACGELQARAGGLQLFLDRPEDLTRTVPYDAASTPLASLIERPWEYAGQHVVVHGTLLRDDGWWLADPTTRGRFPVSSPNRFDAGSMLRVAGIVQYDTEAAAFHLEVLESRPT